MLPERIDIEQIDLTKEKCTESVHLFIEFGENYFRYVGEYYAEEENDDEMLGKKDTYHRWDEKIKRENICVIDLRWSLNNKCYMVEIEASGKGENILLFFKKEKDAQKVYDRLDEFIFGTEWKEKSVKYFEDNKKPQ